MSLEETPKRFLTRELDGKHEVLIIPEDKWLTCQNKGDADAIARVPILEYEALARGRTGSAFATELEESADAMKRHRMGFGHRFLRHQAQEARRDRAGFGDHSKTGMSWE